MLTITNYVSRLNPVTKSVNERRGEWSSTKFGCLAS
nr:MAG TPA: hypothetical protein [Caudoviricetes sp.]